MYTTNAVAFLYFFAYSACGGISSRASDSDNIALQRALPSATASVDGYAARRLGAVLSPAEVAFAAPRVFQVAAQHH